MELKDRMFEILMSAHHYNDSFKGDTRRAYAMGVVDAMYHAREISAEEHKRAIMFLVDFSFEGN